MDILITICVLTLVLLAIDGACEWYNRWSLRRKKRTAKPPKRLPWHMDDGYFD